MKIFARKINFGIAKQYEPSQILFSTNCPLSGCFWTWSLIKLDINTAIDLVTLKLPGYVQWETPIHAWTDLTGNLCQMEEKRTRSFPINLQNMEIRLSNQWDPSCPHVTEYEGDMSVYHEDHHSKINEHIKRSIIVPNST